MTQDKAPEWAEQKAREIYLTTSYPHPTIEGCGKSLDAIALALSQAYERGQESMRERAAAEAWLHSKQGSTHDQIAEAIRSLPIYSAGKDGS